MSTTRGEGEDAAAGDRPRRSRLPCRASRCSRSSSARRDRFTVFVDHPQGVDHALCGRVTDVLRDYLREYTIDVSSPGIERPLRKPAHFRNAVGRKVAAPRRTAASASAARSSSAGERTVTVKTGDDAVEIPYDADRAGQPDRHERKG